MTEALLKIGVVLAVFFLFVAAIGAMLGGILMIAWNYGVLAAFPHAGLGHLSFLQAWALSTACAILLRGARAVVTMNSEKPTR